MPTQTMPDGWSMIAGTWDMGNGAGGDARIVSGSFYGAQALQLGGTAVQTKMVGPWVPLDTTSGLNITYLVEAAAAIASGSPTGTVNFVIYNISRSTVQATFPVVSTLGANAIDGNLFANPGGPWGRFEISKTNTNTGAFNTTFTDFRRASPYWQWQRAANQTVNNNSWTTVTFDGTRLNGDTVDISGAHTDVQLYKSGLYQVSAAAYFRNAPGAGDSAMIRIIDGGNNVVSPTAVSIASGVQDLAVGLSCLVYIPTPNSLRMQVYQSSGAVLTLAGTTTFGGLAWGNSQFSPTAFSGVLVN